MNKVTFICLGVINIEKAINIKMHRTLIYKGLMIKTCTEMILNASLFL